MFPAPGQVLRVRPETFLFRLEDRPVHEGQGVAEDVAVGPDGCGDEHFILFSHAHQSPVETPVAQLAQRHAVGGPVVVAFAPGLDVGRIHGRVPFRRDHPQAAQRAPMLVQGDDGLSEPLVPGFPLAFIFRFFSEKRLLLGHLQYLSAVSKGLEVDDALLHNGGSHIGGKRGFDHVF